MANNTSKRVPSQLLTTDRQILLNLQTLPDYTPRNSSFALSELRAAEEALKQAEDAEVIARRNFEAAREQAVKLGVVLHSLIQGAKAEIGVQYGHDSPVVHAVGLKQKSERKRPTRRKAPTE